MFCIYLLAAGGGIAYAGSSGRIEERMRRHFKGYSSAAGRGLRPDAAYVLTCTRNRSLAFAWEAWLHKAYRPPYSAKTPAKRPRKPPHPPDGTPHRPRSTSRPAPPSRCPVGRNMCTPLARRRRSGPGPGRGTGWEMEAPVRKRRLLLEFGLEI